MPSSHPIRPPPKGLPLRKMALIAKRLTWQFRKLVLTHDRDGDYSAVVARYA